MASVDSTREMQDTARAAAETARAAGAQQAAVSAARVRHVQVDWRDGKMERVKEATTRGLSVELNPRYHADAVRYLRAAEQKVGAPTLMDLLAAEESAA